VRIRTGAATDVGRVREGNEDAFLVTDRFVAVADGMGGHLGGEVASNLALDVFSALTERNEGDLTSRIVEANRAVLERSRRDREVSGMGTTFTVIAFEGGVGRLAHVGDSRAYRFRGGELVALTEDHTLVRRMVNAGEITEEEARAHPQRSVVTRALGADPDVDVDEGQLDLRAGDRYLLCSDGLTGMVREEDIAAVLAEVDDPDAAARRLVDAANANGGHDNITVVIADVVDDAS
jgi:serine/threonine protein phosphatase PrpC